MSREIETNVAPVMNTGEQSGASVPLPAYRPEDQETASVLHDAERRAAAEEPPIPGTDLRR